MTSPLGNFNTVKSLHPNNNNNNAVHAAVIQNNNASLQSSSKVHDARRCAVRSILRIAARAANHILSCTCANYFSHATLNLIINFHYYYYSSLQHAFSRLHQGRPSHTELSPACELFFVMCWPLTANKRSSLCAAGSMKNTAKAPANNTSDVSSLGGLVVVVGITLPHDLRLAACQHVADGHTHPVCLILLGGTMGPSILCIYCPQAHKPLRQAPICSLCALLRLITKLMANCTSSRCTYLAPCTLRYASSRAHLCNTATVLPDKKVGVRYRLIHVRSSSTLFRTFSTARLAPFQNTWRDTLCEKNSIQIAFTMPRKYS